MKTQPKELLKPEADNVQSSFGHRPRGHRTRGIHKREHYDLNEIRKEIRYADDTVYKQATSFK